MGQIIRQKKAQANSAFIYPIPGTSGFSFKKKNLVSVYTDNEIVIVKTFIGMTGIQLKEALKNKTGKSYQLFLKNSEIKYQMKIEECGISEKTLLKAVEESRKPAGDYYNKSTCPSHRRTGSMGLGKKVDLDLDMSRFAAPEVEMLKNKVQNPREGIKKSHYRTNSATIKLL